MRCISSIRRCESSGIVVCLIDPEFRQLAADTIGATEQWQRQV
jgi:hypothetical protein